MDQTQYREILIIDIKNNGYKWDTVRGKGGSEVALADASISQLKAIKYSLKKGSNVRSLRRAKQKSRSKLMFEL